jgi:hypothetical protein
MRSQSKYVAMGAAFAVTAMATSSANADPIQAGNPFLESGTFVDSMSKGMRDAQRSGPAVRMKVRSHEMFYQLSLRMTAQEVVQILGLPEKQNIQDELMPVVGSDKKAYKTMVCFGYDNVVTADKSIQQWVVVFDENGLRGWKYDNLDGCENN